jgi:hypothetical protein
MLKRSWSFGSKAESLGPETSEVEKIVQIL